MRLINCTRAKREFGLKAEDLYGIRFVHASNPVHPGFPNMKLFKWLDVAQRAEEKGGKDAEGMRTVHLPERLASIERLGSAQGNEIDTKMIKLRRKR